MSLLLDALNKADQERKRGDGPPSIDSHHDAYRTDDRSATPTFLIVLGIGAALIILLASVYWLGMQTKLPTTTIAPVAQPSNAQTGAQTTAPIVTPTTQDTAVQLSTRNTTNNHNSDDPKNTIENNTIQVVTTPEDEGVATLYQQQSINNPAIINNNLNTFPAADLPQNTLPSAAINTAPATTSPTSIKQFANLPELNDLPSSILEKVPTLKYTEHHYHHNGGNVVINGTVMHVNDQVSNGVVIDKILEDGMILHIENYSFKMRALNTWINM
jgi:general secretion pathway protein B